MKYFTPDRWARMQRDASKADFQKAYDEWEKAVRDYDEELKQIIPAGRRFGDLRDFALLHSLHDAELEACWFGEPGKKLNLLVRPELPEEPLYLLTYFLVGQPVVQQGVLPEEFTSKRLVWMYDEFGLPGGQEGEDDLVFTHAILLSNGCEYLIRFSNLKVTRHLAWPNLPSASGSRAQSLQTTG